MGKKSRRKKQGDGEIISQVGESRLREIVRKPDSKTGIGREDALKELSHRLGTGCLDCADAFTEFAARYARNSRTAPELRKIATVALGKNHSPIQQRALLKGLDAEDPMLVKKAAAALGSTGEPDVCDALTQAQPGEEHPANQALRFAESLISYRHGLDTHLIRPISSNHFLKIGGSRRTSLDLERIGAVRLRRELNTNSSEIEAIIPFCEERAWKFRCGVRDVLLIFNRNFLNREFIGNLDSTNAVFALLLDLDACSGRRYVREYILTNPARRGSGSIVGVDTLGEKIHSGRFTPSGTQLKFTLRTGNTRHAKAIDLKGIFDCKKKSIELSRAHLLKGLAKGQKSRKEPSPA